MFIFNHKGRILYKVYVANNVDNTIYYRVHVYTEGAIYYEYTGTESEITKALRSEKLVFV